MLAKDNMVQLTELSLEDYRRPVIKIKNTTALIDTGETIPMLYIKPFQLMDYCDGISKVFDHATVTGIGHQEIAGKVFNLKNFKVGDLLYKNLHVFIPDIISADENSKPTHAILLSVTMFEGLDYEFDTINKKFLVFGKSEQDKEVDFILVKTQKGQLVPVVNNIFIQESAEVLYAMDNYAQIGEPLDEELED